jgi:transcriptional regulator with XRE-family HTH domain
MLSLVSVKPWVAAIHRLLKAERRPDPRPKQGRTPDAIFWNGADLAEAAKIRTNTLSDAMTGKREPSVTTLVAIAQALNVPLAALFMEADEAEAYVRFRHHQTAAGQTADLEATVRRIVNERAAQWAEQETQTVMAELTEAPATKKHGAKKSA